MLLITGATGFVGNVLLGELLGRGHRCMVLLRPPTPTRKDRLIESLCALGVDARRLIQTGRLRTLVGTLPDALPARLAHPVRSVVHVAGSTRFNPDPLGEPGRTNDDGTRRLLDWMDTHEIHEIHHVSTAYIFGHSQTLAPESVPEAPPDFRNAYERSKWLGERHVWRWAQAPGHRCTIYRPSIVVGDWQTGYATRFSGPYHAFRALDTVSRSARSFRDRQLRIEASRDADLNLIPVDYLAELMASIIDHPAYHGRVYNIVHPDPISTEALFEMFGRIFGLSCDRIDGMGTASCGGPTPGERRFRAATRHISAYLCAPPRFERSNTARAERLMSRSCPTWDEPAINRLIDYARQQGWGREP